MRLPCAWLQVRPYLLLTTYDLLQVRPYGTSMSLGLLQLLDADCAARAAGEEEGGLGAQAECDLERCNPV